MTDLIKIKLPQAFRSKIWNQLVPYSEYFQIYELSSIVQSEQEITKDTLINWSNEKNRTILECFDYDIINTLNDIERELYSYFNEQIKSNELKNKIEVEKEDFVKILQGWYWGLDEYNNTDDKEFNNMLKKYNINIKDIR